jgi:dihydroxy-acid dehydratase
LCSNTGEFTRRSDRIKKGLERAPQRALLYATGLTTGDMSKPFIGVASSFTDLIPGHIGMRRLERFIERGVVAGGGVPFIFGIPGICDGIAMGAQWDALFSGIQRTDSGQVETVCLAHQLDGLVCLTNCDKITPGMLMAAARLNIPAIVCTAGPMMSGNYRNIRRSFVRDTFEAVGKCTRGEIAVRRWLTLRCARARARVRARGCIRPTTMACLTETLGMSLPGCGTALANSAKKDRIAQDG